MTAAGPADWLDQVQADSRTQGLQLTAQSAEGAKRLTGKFNSMGTNTVGKISFKAMPPGEHLELVLQSPVQWRIADLKPGARLSISVMRSGHGNTKGELCLAPSSAGHISLDMTDSQMPVTADAACTSEVVLTGGSLVIGEDGLGGVKLVLAGGVLGGGKLSAARLAAETSIEPVNNQAVAVNSLVVDGERTMVFPATGARIEIGALLPAAENANLRMTRREQQSRGSSTSAMSVSIKTLDRVTIRADPSMSLAIGGRASDAIFAGSTSVEFGGRAVGDNLQFAPDGEQAPRLGAKPNAVLTGVHGELVLTGIKGAHLAGADSGLLIRNIATVGQRAGGNATGLCDEAFLSNFRVPSGLAGRSLLNHLDRAHHVDPSTSDLPGWNLRFRRVGTPTPERRHDAELMRKMRELAREKGASGSARTKIGWCAQRLRHETTSGGMERAALLGYRCLGYGERPGPAFATWLVLSFLFAGLLMQLPSSQVSSCLDFLRLWAERAVSPVGTIVGSGAGTEKDAWLYLVRAAVAIPLVVGALSLRNYVRAGR